MRKSTGPTPFEETKDGQIVNGLLNLKKTLIGAGIVLQAEGYESSAIMLLRAEFILDDVISEVKGECDKNEFDDE